MNTLFLDRTARGLPIPGYSFGEIGPPVLILGGVHGDEPEGVALALGLVNAWRSEFKQRLRVTVIPALNVDGVLAHQRANARGVDLNRNLPTTDWTREVLNPRYNPGPRAGSEPENEALLGWLKTHSPRVVFALHSFREPMVNVNGPCGPVAERLAAAGGYPVKESIGYPTPGCLGTYLGLERGVPTLTYELLRGLPTETILKTHVPAVIEALRVVEAEF